MTHVLTMNTWECNRRGIRTMLRFADKVRTLVAFFMLAKIINQKSCPEVDYSSSSSSIGAASTFSISGIAFFNSFSTKFRIVI
jgi:hypothetical protein